MVLAHVIISLKLTTDKRFSERGPESPINTEDFIIQIHVYCVP